MKSQQTSRGNIFACLLTAMFLLVLPQVCAAQGKIVFSSGRDGVDLEIYVMNGDGTNQTRLTNNSVADKDPAFSSDGSRIVYSSNRDIYVMNADGSNKVALTNDGFASDETDPAFSPDGARIAYASDSQIYTMNAFDGTDKRRLTNGAFQNEQNLYLSYSPDGNRIVFSSTLNAKTFEIYTMNAADGLNPTRLTFDDAGDDIDPTFNSSGSKIAFSSIRDGNYEIYVMDANGANQTRLTFFATQFATFARQPSFSPDNSKIAYSFFQNTQLKVYVMNADGSNQIALTNTPGNKNPFWSGQTPPAAPKTKLKIAGGNILVGSPGKGIILKASGGACKLLSIDNAGAMVLTTVASP